MRKSRLYQLLATGIAAALLPAVTSTAPAQAAPAQPAPPQVAMLIYQPLGSYAIADDWVLHDGNEVETRYEKTPSSSNAHRWNLEQVKPGRFTISTGSNLCLTTDSLDGVVHLKTCDGDVTQEYLLGHNSTLEYNEYWIIPARNENYALGLLPGEQADHKWVRPIRTFGGPSQAQTWRITTPPRGF